MLEQVGWHVSQVNGVSMEGICFNSSMGHLEARPLRVLFETPLMDSDAGTEDARVSSATASPMVAVDETKRRVYKHDAASTGGVRVSDVLTSSRNMIAIQTPPKDRSMPQIRDTAVRAELEIETKVTRTTATDRDAEIGGRIQSKEETSQLEARAAFDARQASKAQAQLDAAREELRLHEPATQAAQAKVDSKTTVKASRNPFSTDIVGAKASPKEAIVESKKRIYAYDAKRGGVTCASVTTECRNLLSDGLGSTPIKRDVVCTDETSSPAPDTNYDSGSGPYVVVVWHKIATAEEKMRVTVKSATADPATVADLKEALLAQTLAAHQGLLKTPVRIIEVTPEHKFKGQSVPEMRTELGDQVGLKGVVERQLMSGQVLVVENVAKPAAVPLDGIIKKSATTLLYKTASKTLLSCGAANNEMGPDLFASPAPNGAGAPNTAAAAAALAAELFPPPAGAQVVRPAGSRGSDTSGRATFPSKGGSDWVNFDTPVKS